MDYGSGKKLYKHQWDLVHDPENMVFTFLEEDEEGMAVKEGITEKQLRDLCYSYNLKENVSSQKKYNHQYMIASTGSILKYYAGNREETCIFPSDSIADVVLNNRNELNYDAYSNDVYIGNGIYDKIINTLKTEGVDATCPAVFDREEKEDFAIELLRALRLSHRNNRRFKYDFVDNVNISLSSLTLPDVKDSAGIKKGEKLTDVEILVNVQSLSDIDINEYELQTERNYLSKNDKYLCLGKNGDEYAMKIKTNEDCFNELFEYISGTEAPEIITKDEVIAKFEQSTVQSVSDAISFVTEEKKAACNICTRAALYYLTDDPVLFPATGSSIDGKTPDIKGQISGNGSAQYVVSDLSDYQNNALKDYFVCEVKQDSESYEEFWERLQNEVDRGEIIIGTYSTNHVFMIVPGGMIKVIDNSMHTEINEKTDRRVLMEEYKKNPIIEQGDKYGFCFVLKGIKTVPRILECGINVKSANAPIYANMDYKGVANNVKWYRYIK
jgi:hypothetical protein